MLHQRVTTFTTLSPIYAKSCGCIAACCVCINVAVCNSGMIVCNHCGLPQSGVFCTFELSFPLLLCKSHLTTYDLSLHLFPKCCAGCLQVHHPRSFIELLLAAGRALGPIIRQFFSLGLNRVWLNAGDTAYKYASHEACMHTDTNTALLNEACLKCLMFITSIAACNSCSTGLCGIDMTVLLSSLCCNPDTTHIKECD